MRTSDSELVTWVNKDRKQREKRENPGNFPLELHAEQYKKTPVFIKALLKQLEVIRTVGLFSSIGIFITF